MKTHRLALFVCLPLTVLFSCTVQRRVYQPGYHVEWNKHLSSAHTEATDTRNRPADADESLTAAPFPQSGAIDTDSLPVTTSSENASVPSASVLSASVPAERSTPVNQLSQPVKKVVSNVKDHLPKLVQLHPKAAGETSAEQVKSRGLGGLILAPLRIIFTILLIALIATGLILLFVLDSALGGTVLLAAGVVLLILIIL